MLHVAIFNSKLGFQKRPFIYDFSNLKSTHVRIAYLFLTFFITSFTKYFKFFQAFIRDKIISIDHLQII